MHCMSLAITIVFIAVARPTLSVDRQLRYSFKPPKVPVSRSRRSRNRLSGSRTALWASRTNRLAAGRRTASRSRNCDKHDSDHLRMQCIRRRALTYLEATPTPRPFQAFSGGYLQASSLAASTAGRLMAQCREAYSNCVQSPRAMVV